MKTKARSTQNTLILNKSNKKQKFNIQSTSPDKFLNVSMQIGKQQKKQNNFVLANTRNLKNFFKDRIPNQKNICNEKPQNFSPARIFKLRKQQSEMQQGTKIKLNNTFDGKNLFIGSSIDKLNQTFQVSTKYQQILSKNLKNNSKTLKMQSSLSTYQTPTSSSMIKRSSTTKKRAYISVFGDCPLNIGSRTFIQNLQNQQQKTKQNPRPRTQQFQRKTDNLDQFRSKLSNLQAYASQINPFRYDFGGNQRQKILEQGQIKQQPETKKQQQNEILSWVKSVTDNYKKKNIKISRIKTIQDIEKMDPAYYKKMKAHKQGRLWVRNKALNDINVYSNCNDFNKINDQGFSQINNKLQEQLDNNVTITDRMLTIEEQKIQKVTSKHDKFFVSKNIIKKQKFQKFIDSLLSSVNLAKLYGIKNQNVYSCLWQQRKPFELQGSYAYFKFIKAGNIQMIMSFVKQNQQYLYQIDNQGRSALVYAAQNNHQDIVKFMLTMGVNVDLADCYGKTALFYALRHNNQKLVQSILVGGGSPWSNKYFNINQMIKKCDQKIQVLIKNARRIHVARNLIYKPKVKLYFWQINKQKIKEQKQIIF